ncbi:MAG TPA: hypothetical protein DF613_08760, partial [Lachnospiraceae bacterium]|nr:hypothetical protein [Lachnospiraceae bacterium]
MEASKKWYRRLMGFICALAGIVLLRAVPVTAAGNDAGNFTITGVETGGKAMKLVRHEKESHIYIADLPLASPYKELVIHGTVTGGGTPAVAASDMLGHRFQAERAGSDVTITRAATEERMYGAYVCHIDVGEEQYTLVLDCGINSGPLYLLDATADQYDYLGEETWLRKGHSSEDSRLVRAGLPGSVKAVALECEKDCVKTEKYSVDAMSWIAGGENYVRINRGAAHRFNGTLSGGASSSSGRLPLK